MKNWQLSCITYVCMYILHVMNHLKKNLIPEQFPQPAPCSPIFICMYEYTYVHFGKCARKIVCETFVWNFPHAHYLTRGATALVDTFSCVVFPT